MFNVLFHPISFKGILISSVSLLPVEAMVVKRDPVRLLLSHLMHSAKRSRHSDGQRLRPRTIAGSAWRGSLRERSAVGERVSDVKDGEYRLGITGLWEKELTKTATGPRGWVGFEEVRRLDLVNLSPSLISGGIYYFEVWGWLGTPLYF